MQKRASCPCDTCTVKAVTSRADLAARRATASWLPWKPTDAYLARFQNDERPWQLRGLFPNESHDVADELRTCIGWVAHQDHSCGVLMARENEPAEILVLRQQNAPLTRRPTSTCAR